MEPVYRPIYSIEVEGYVFHALFIAVVICMQELRDACLHVQFLVPAFSHQGIYEWVDLPMVCVLPIAFVGNNLEGMGKRAPCFFGSLKPIAHKQLIAGVFHQPSAVYRVWFYGRRGFL